MLVLNWRFPVAWRQNNKLLPWILQYKTTYLQPLKYTHEWMNWHHIFFFFFLLSLQHLPALVFLHFFIFQVNKHAQYPSLIERKAGGGGGSSKEYLPHSPMSPSCYEPIIANFPKDESTGTISNHTLTHYSVLRSEQNALSRSLINS